ncbi:hypothetical protein [Leifsonia sp. NPDC058230]|uniref:hypothetical protein n=1 Tax=Leifsonia sp. NPDC058230 TaxID=3346391 RepID=UPI0036DAA750
MPLAKPAFWLTALELFTWAIFSTAIVFALIIAPITTGAHLLIPYLLYIALLSFARSVRYLDMTGVRQSRTDTFVGFLIAPLYGVMHIVFLIWLRLYSLATLRSGTWGTRSSVEVSLGDGST